MEMTGAQSFGKFGMRNGAARSIRSASSFGRLLAFAVLMHGGRPHRLAAPVAPNRVHTDHALTVARRTAPYCSAPS